MKNRAFLSLILTLCLVFSGCSMYDGRYSHVVPHQLQSAQNQSQTLRARSAEELCRVLDSLVMSATSNAAIYIEGIDEEELDAVLEVASDYIRMQSPVGVFALEDVSLEVGTNRGRTAIAAELTFNRSTVEIRQMITAGDIAQARTEIENALIAYRPRLALHILEYKETDFTQMVADLSRENIQNIMESPHVAEEIFGKTDSRVVELNFSYENSRDALRAMQTQVQPIFNAANLYVSGDTEESRKYSHLYAFLMERFDYTYETSITPAYSLLMHGVGDSRTFAYVYAAMCRNAGLTCDVITGTRHGEPWVWNRIAYGENEYYVDLIRCAQNGDFWAMRPGELTGYVWDYSELMGSEQEETIAED